MDTVNRGEQTRRRAVPARVLHGQPHRTAADLVARGRLVAVVVRRVGRRRRRGRATVPEQFDGPQRTDGPGGRALDDNPRAPDHGEREHFQRVRRRYGHHVIAAALGQHGHHHPTARPHRVLTDGEIAGQRRVQPGVRYCVDNNGR